MKKILVIGSSNLDLVVDVPYMPKAGETILGGKTVKIPGGKGANQAVACGKLGGSAAFLSAIGDDEPGEILIKSLKSANVNIDGLIKVPGGDTGTAYIYINPDGENCIVVIPGANNYCDAAFIKNHDDKFLDCDIVIIQGEIPRDGIFYSIKHAKELGKTVIFNPAPAPADIPADVWKCVDFLTPNESELERLTGISTHTDDNIIKACQALLDRGVSNVIVTLGAKGAMLYNDGSREIYPAYEADVVDTTAAGDTFNGAFAVAFAMGWQIADAIGFANKASALAVSKKGAQASIPSFAEVESFDFRMRQP